MKKLNLPVSGEGYGSRGPCFEFSSSLLLAPLLRLILKAIRLFSKVPAISDMMFQLFASNVTSNIDSSSMDRTINDDYFPQGDEFEDEIGKDDLPRNRNAKRDLDDDIENMTPVALLQSSHSTNFPTLHLNPLFGKLTNLLNKEINDNETIDRLKTLVKKAVDFKRRVFQTKGEEDQKFDSKNDESKSNSNGHDKLVPIF